MISATPYKVIVIYKEKAVFDGHDLGVVSVKFETKNYTSILKDIKLPENGDPREILRRFAEVFSVLKIVIRGKVDPIPAQLRKDPEALLLLAVESLRKTLQQNV